MAELTDEFLDDTAEAAAGLASFYVGIAESEMIAGLYDVEAELEARLQPLGADVAAELAETFCAIVILRRRELEAAGSGATSPVVLN